MPLKTRSCPGKQDGITHGNRSDQRDRKPQEKRATVCTEQQADGYPPQILVACSANPRSMLQVLRACRARLAGRSSRAHQRARSRGYNHMCARAGRHLARASHQGRHRSRSAQDGAPWGHEGFCREKAAAIFHNPYKPVSLLFRRITAGIHNTSVISHSSWSLVRRCGLEILAHNRSALVRRCGLEILAHNRSVQPPMLMDTVRRTVGVARSARRGKI